MAVRRESPAPPELRLLQSAQADAVTAAGDQLYYPLGRFLYALVAVEVPRPGRVLLSSTEVAKLLPSRTRLFAGVLFSGNFVPMVLGKLDLAPSG
jgi:hypothetical protein